MDGLITEIQKIPPITRFLCGSSLAVTLSVLTHVVSPHAVFFTKDLVFQKLQIWRLWTSFFLGSGGINYIFELAMLYRTSNELESGPFHRRSADLGWQLLFASGAIIALTTPLKSFFFSRPLLICLTYISASLAPPGAQSSLMGLITYPAKYTPYMMIGFDLLMGGPSAAAQGVVGALVGHLWWWGIWGSGEGAGGRGVLEEMGRAPGWLKGLVGESDQAAGGGVQVIPPRRPLGGNSTGGAGGSTTTTSERNRGSGYNWGSGQRLGTE
ncbi:DER1-domain-containing protein [Pluteus cervinus]|uniref:DER1-domain-containing protein n=1 Tax=Pluteus cervinus TaxID=181527 RepID=A0ACD3AEM6_9AGAR|nr:DER1-domain-containing protein [Pluteus cervinus]